MPVTTNFQIPFPDGTTKITPLQDHFANIANAVENALNTGLGGAPRIAASDSERNTIYPAPVQGNTVLRTDKGYTEQYFGLFDAGTNPGGATPSGWYPVSGNTPGFHSTQTATQSVTGAATNVLFPVSGTVNRGNITFVPTTGLATIVVPGTYRVGGQVVFTSGATANSRVLNIAKNGSSAVSGIQVSSSITTVALSHEMVLTTGDAIALTVISGSTPMNIGVAGNAYWSTFTIDYVGPPR